MATELPDFTELTRAGSGSDDLTGRTDPFADLLTLERDPEPAPAVGTIPLARHGVFGDGLFGEAKPTAPRGLVAGLLGGTGRSIVAIGVGLGVVVGIAVSALGGSGDGADPTAAAAKPGRSSQAGQAGQAQGAAPAGAGQSAQPAGQQGSQPAGQQGGASAAPSGAAKPSGAGGLPTLTGSFTLWSAAPQQNPCADHPQVPDIVSGATVVVTDAAGRELARTKLTAGKAEATQRGCAFPFSVAGLPKADGYQIKVGRQAALTFASADLGKAGWRVLLNLGLPDQPPG